ncbi:hypothetical protein C357_16196 [Citreicella sp. 357]|nr:hypothetical protein C357_16196 [Citreicella sp. 357]
MKWQFPAAEGPGEVNKLSGRERAFWGIRARRPNGDFPPGGFSEEVAACRGPRCAEPRDLHEVRLPVETRAVRNICRDRRAVAPASVAERENIGQRNQ